MKPEKPKFDYSMFACFIGFVTIIVTIAMMLIVY